MARVVNEQEHALRRNQILEAAQRLVYSVGFEQMSIQNILDELHISKGAFYHYFASKEALLEAVVDLMQKRAESVIVPIAHDPNLPAIEKLQRFFNTSVKWKIENKDYILALMRIWYADQNAVVRQKIEARAIQEFAPLISGIIQQGVDEGVFDTPLPQQSGTIVIAMMQGMGKGFADMLLTHPPPPDALQQLELLMDAYTRSLERILGVAPHSLQLIDQDSLAAWF